ncbi:MAG: HPF/RaiA family ribosome-associated protein [Gemmatimonadota bacterium]
MEFTVHARHGKVPDSLRNQAVRRFGRLEKIDNRITSGTIVFDGAPSGRRVEARLYLAGGPPIVGHGEGNTMRGAMEGALHRLERQLKRRRRRMIDRRSRPVGLRETATT